VAFAKQMTDEGDVGTTVSVTREGQSLPPLPSSVTAFGGDSFPLGEAFVGATLAVARFLGAVLLRATARADSPYQGEMSSEARQKG